MGGCTTNFQNFADMGSLGSMRIYYRSDSIAKGLPVNPHCDRWKYHRKVIPGLRGACVLRVVGSNKQTVNISPEITADNWKQIVRAPDNMLSRQTPHASRGKTSLTHTSHLKKRAYHISVAV